MTVLVWLCGGLTLALAAYAMGHLACVLVLLLNTGKSKTWAQRPSTPVHVLVPARNEGAAAIRAIDSLVAQDHAGPVHITLLLRDREDSSLAYLAAAYPDCDLGGTGTRIVLLNTPDRHVEVAFTSAERKSDKINWMAPRVKTPLVAVLDCDHQAQPAWLRTSVCQMADSGSRIVQGVRNPLVAHGFFPLWDSLHQHVGCELFNHAFTRMGLTVFFTGTTVVMETRLLQDHPLHECITEDVNFSYEILSQGIQIAHNAQAGSFEEVSPDLYSFLSRRRRWANGHTEAFLRHLGGIRRAPLRWRDKLQFLLHGVHYLVCSGVFALHLVIGLLFVRPLTWVGIGAAAATGLVIAIWLARSLPAISLRIRLLELALLFGWVFPAVVIGFNLALAWLTGDYSQTMLPLPGALQALGLVGLGTPLVVLLVGLRRFSQLSLGTGLVVVLTYPVAFYLDLCGVLLGLMDGLMGRRRWHAVGRGIAAPTDPMARVAQVVPVGILASWRIEDMIEAAPQALGRGLAAMLHPQRLVPASLVLGISCSGVLYAPSNQVRVADVDCEALAHDGEPWIVPAKKMVNYCGPAARQRTPQWGTRTGSLKSVRRDDLNAVDPTYWDKLDTTFFCNESVFSPENVQPGPQGGIQLLLEARANGDRQYSSASIATQTDRHLYGRFETVMKPASISGVLTAFFLYRFDPWQEIDFEFVGRDTTRVLLNVFYNPGEEGDLYNYGFRGTPVMVDLGFDASQEFHAYAIEWEPGEIRWFVDDRLIHRRVAGQPTPVPHLPMRFHVNIWPTCSEELAGTFDPSALPGTAQIKSITLSEWTPPARSGLPKWLKGLFETKQASGDWRDRADWIQPGR
jgi:beta-glucanase (GH16 family)